MLRLFLGLGTARSRKKTISKVPWTSPRMGINLSSSADRFHKVPQSMPTHLSSHSPCYLPCDALRAQSDSFLALDPFVVDSFHPPRLPLLQPLPVLILEGTPLSSGRTRARMSTCSLHTLSSDNRRPYGNPVLSIPKELQASPTTEKVCTFYFLNYLLRPN